MSPSSTHPNLRVCSRPGMSPRCATKASHLNAPEAHTYVRYRRKRIFYRFGGGLIRTDRYLPEREPAFQVLAAPAPGRQAPDAKRSMTKFMMTKRSFFKTSIS